MYKFLRAIPDTTLAKIGTANATGCGIPPDNSMHLFRPVTDDDYPWTGIIFGLTVSSVWYWCSDQVILMC